MRPRLSVALMSSVQVTYAVRSPIRATRTWAMRAASLVRNTTRKGLMMCAAPMCSVQVTYAVRPPIEATRTWSHESSPSRDEDFCTCCMPHGAPCLWFADEIGACGMWHAHACQRSQHVLLEIMSRARTHQRQVSMPSITPGYTIQRATTQKRVNSWDTQALNLTGRNAIGRPQEDVHLIDVLI